MAGFDWDSIEDEFKGDFKPYAADGTYEVKLDKVEKKTTGNGKIVFEFFFQEDDEQQYPKASRFFFSDEKKKFRMFHYRNILMVLGMSKENAQKAIESCEGKNNDEAITDAYAQTFNRGAQKHPKIKIEVSTEEGSNGKSYARAEFADPSIHFSNNKKPASSPSIDVTEESDDASDSIDISEIPFD